MRRRLALLVLMATVGVFGHGGARALAATALGWGHALQIDHRATVTELSCPAVSLCVAGDDDGNMLMSTNPFRHGSSWRLRHVGGKRPILGLSCPSVSLCVAVDNGGDVFVSTGLARMGSSWTRISVDRRGALDSISS